MAADKSKAGGTGTGSNWLWKQLLQRFDSSGSSTTTSSSAVPIPTNGRSGTVGATSPGSVTSAGEAFESGSSSNGHHHDPDHKNKSGLKDGCSCSSCQCSGDHRTGNNGDPSVVDMIRSLDTFAGSKIDPSQDHWIESLHKLMTDYFINSRSTNVRLRALDILSMCLHDFSYIHEDLVIDTIVIKVRFFN